ncbi:hypothetical protein E2C01_071536 [Portunus trituberculatus]|uniref:Uncharacterized protein n=1 Tax=Portunus trituberculatus TaxID=210409 RepID=A0A5B7HVL0_PORTR|nr:hypothetical protein [Portunus trituberculatus]
MPLHWKYITWEARTCRP